MEVSSTIAATTTAGSLKSFLLARNPTVLSIAAGGSLPVDSISSPTIVRSDPYRTAPRALIRRRRRTRRRSLTDDSGEEALSGDGDGDDGPFGGSGGGRGGGGRGFGGDGANPDWEEEEERSSDLAFDFVYEVISFVVLSHCVHFSCKKIGRLFTDGEKVVPVRLVQPIC